MREKPDNSSAQKPCPLSISAGAKNSIFQNLFRGLTDLVTLWQKFRIFLSFFWGGLTDRLHNVTTVGCQESGSGCLGNILPRCDEQPAKMKGNRVRPGQLRKYFFLGDDDTVRLCKLSSFLCCSLVSMPDAKKEH